MNIVENLRSGLVEYRIKHPRFYQLIKSAFPVAASIGTLFGVNANVNHDPYFPLAPELVSRLDQIQDNAFWRDLDVIYTDWGNRIEARNDASSLAPVTGKFPRGFKIKKAVAWVGNNPDNPHNEKDAHTWFLALDPKNRNGAFIYSGSIDKKTIPAPIYP